MFEIDSIFDSIQGEGLGIGQPATFVRAAGCNLRCPHCDTNWIAEEWSEEHLAYAIGTGQAYTVLTGGEPLAQPGLAVFCAGHCKEGITIETNGTFVMPPPLRRWKGVTWSVSPKLPWFCPEYRPNWGVLSSFNLAWGTLQWKFVVRNAWDIEDALEMVATVSPTEGIVILQPPNFRQAGDSRSAYLDLLRRLSERVLGMGPLRWDVRVLPQLHILEGLQ